MFLLPRKTQGFTLIELIIVIVLLGILAATALPRFVDFSSDAELKKNASLAASLNTAVQLVYNKWILDGKPTDISLFDSTLRTSPVGGCGIDDGATCSGHIECVPSETSCGSDGGSNNQQCADVWNTLLDESAPSAAPTCTGSCEYQATGNNGTYQTICCYRDKQGSGSNYVTYDISTGAASASTSCPAA